MNSRSKNAYLPNHRYATTKTIFYNKIYRLIENARGLFWFTDGSM